MEFRICSVHPSKKQPQKCTFSSLYLAKVWTKKISTRSKYWLLVKKSIIFVLSHEAWWKWLPHQMTIFTKFHGDRIKNVYFFINSQFLNLCRFFCSDFTKVVQLMKMNIAIIVLQNIIWMTGMILKSTWHVYFLQKVIQTANTN